jgi:hypothetical protein
MRGVQMDNNNMVETRTCQAGNFISDPEIMYNGILWGGGTVYLGTTYECSSFYSSVGNDSILLGCDTLSQTNQFLTFHTFY